MIRIAIPSTEPLLSECRILMERIGIYFPDNSRNARATASNFPIEVIFANEYDLPTLADNGLVDLIIAGQHVINEQQTKVKTLRPLGIGQGCLGIVASVGVHKLPDTYNGITIVTPLPNILNNFLQKTSSKAKVIRTESVRSIVSAGAANVYFDYIHHSEDLGVSKLRLVEKICNSEAVLAVSRKMPLHYTPIVDELMFRLNSCNDCVCKKLITIHVPIANCDELLNQLPCLTKPIIYPLNSEICMIQSVMDEVRFWDVLDNIKANKAFNIVMTPVDKIID